MTNRQPTYFPEAGSLSVMMGDADGYVAIAADASVIAATSKLPPGVTVAKTETGVYTLTFSKPFNLLVCTPTFQSTAAVALFAQNGLVTTQTVAVRLVNGSGTATNPSAACGFAFHIRFKDSSVTP